MLTETEEREGVIVEEREQRRERERLRRKKCNDKEWRKAERKTEKGV